MAIINNSKELTRGDTAIFSVTLRDLDGDEYIPSANETLTFYLLKKDCDDLTKAVLVKDIPTNRMELELTPSETKELDTGSYSYRIRLRDEEAHEWTVVKSKIKVIC